MIGCFYVKSPALRDIAVFDVIWLLFKLLSSVFRSRPRFLIFPWLF